MASSRSEATPRLLGASYVSGALASLLLEERKNPPSLREKK
jgi:hypothetical protein